MHGGHHEHLSHPGLFAERAAPLQRDFANRGYTVGIGGPVGSGKTSVDIGFVSFAARRTFTGRGDQ